MVRSEASELTAKELILFSFHTANRSMYPSLYLTLYPRAEPLEQSSILAHLLSIDDRNVSESLQAQSMAGDRKGRATRIRVDGYSSKERPALQRLTAATRIARFDCQHAAAAFSTVPSPTSTRGADQATVQDRLAGAGGISSAAPDQGAHLVFGNVMCPTIKRSVRAGALNIGIVKLPHRRGGQKRVEGRRRHLAVRVVN